MSANVVFYRYEGETKQNSRITIKRVMHRSWHATSCWKRIGENKAEWTGKQKRERRDSCQWLKHVKVYFDILQAFKNGISERSDFAVVRIVVPYPQYPWGLCCLNKKIKKNDCFWVVMIKTCRCVGVGVVTLFPVSYTHLTLPTTILV